MNILKKGTKFTVLNASGNREEVSRKDVPIEFIQEKMSMVYFRLGHMYCKTPKKEMPNDTRDRNNSVALHPDKVC